MTVRIVRVADDLPEGFDRMQTEAAAEGVHNMARLREDWAHHRFQPPAALFAAFVGADLAGVGGVVPQTELPAMRMTRLYVRPAFRRQHVGRELAAVMIEHGLRSARQLTVNAGASPAAAPFWRSMGFAPVPHDGYTHLLTAAA